MDKDQRRTMWQRSKAKRREDHNHGKRGWVSGNPRYERGRTDGKNRTMGAN